MPVPPMDVFGIVYIIESAPQFWSGAHPPSLNLESSLMPSDVKNWRRSCIYLTKSPSPSSMLPFDVAYPFVRHTMVSTLSR